MRDLKQDADTAIVSWFTTISANCPNDPLEVVEDGRETQGISRLTGADITSVITQFLAYQTQLDQSGVAGVISKPCVRLLR
jgi:hypothetical protein